METLEIRSLANIPFSKVYESFIDSFSDYEVPMQMSIDKLKEMFVTRDVDFNYSVGCFDNDRLVGFIICGYREIGGKRYCYDAGTGIVPDFRRRGIADRLFIYLADILKQNKVDIFLLEVLVNNTPAIELYKKKGFVIQRQLDCFKIDKSEIVKVSLDNRYAIKYDKSEYRGVNDADYQELLPSWQNDRASILNNIDNLEYCSISFNDQIVAFGVIHKQQGDILQLRVLKGWEDKQLELYVIDQLKNKTKSDIVKTVTLDENSPLKGVLLNLGFSNFVNLYEMTLSFER